MGFDDWADKIWVTALCNYFGYVCWARFRCISGKVFGGWKMRGNEAVHELKIFMPVAFCRRWKFDFTSHVLFYVYICNSLFHAYIPKGYTEKSVQVRVLHFHCNYTFSAIISSPGVPISGCRLFIFASLQRMHEPKSWLSCPFCFVV